MRRAIGLMISQFLRILAENLRVEYCVTKHGMYKLIFSKIWLPNVP